MVKVEIKDIKHSFYDDRTNELVFRESLFKEPKENIEKILQEEITHFEYRHSKAKNFFYEFYRLILFLILTPIVLYYSYYLTYAGDLHNCVNAYNSFVTSVNPTYWKSQNVTPYEILKRFNQTQNISIPSPEYPQR